MSDNLDALEQAAEAAIKKPDEPAGIIRNGSISFHDTNLTRFYDACTPAAILALIQRCREAERRVRDFEAPGGGCITMFD